MDAPGRETHDQCALGISQSRTIEEDNMWQLHAAFRVGGYRTQEFDVTPALCVAMIVTVVGLIIRTGL
jgi:hypothetical protein